MVKRVRQFMGISDDSRYRCVLSQFIALCDCSCVAASCPHLAIGAQWGFENQLSLVLRMCLWGVLVVFEPAMGPVIFALRGVAVQLGDLRV